MNKQEFLKLVDNYTDRDESTLGDLLNIVTTKFNRMVEREKNRRDSAHLKALHCLLDEVTCDKILDKTNPELFGNMACCSLLDAISEVYPTAKGSSICGKALLKHYAKSVHALGWKPNDYFIKDVRGKEEWLRRLYSAYNVD